MKFSLGRDREPATRGIDGLVRPLAIQPELPCKCIPICVPAPNLLTRPEVSGHDTEKEIGRTLSGADDGACRGHVGRRHGHCRRTGALSVPRRPRSQRRDKAQSTKSPLALGPRPFPSLWNARPPRPGRQSPAPRRPGQRDTVKGTRPGRGSSERPSLPVFGGSCPRLAGLAGKELRRRPNVIVENPSSAGFPPRDAGKSRGAIGH
jgi:hypothetical protein